MTSTAIHPAYLQLADFIFGNNSFQEKVNNLKKFTGLTLSENIVVNGDVTISEGTTLYIHTPGK